MSTPVNKSTVSDVASKLKAQFESSMVTSREEAIKAHMARRLGNLFLGSSRKSAESIVDEPMRLFGQSNLTFDYHLWRAVTGQRLLQVNCLLDRCRLASTNSIDLDDTDLKLIATNT